MPKNEAGNEDLPTGSRLTALDEGFRNDPYPILHLLRKRDPVHWDGELRRWFVTEHHLVEKLASDRSLSVDARKAGEGSFARMIDDTGGQRSMLGLDDPDHRRLRSFVSRAFGPTAVEAIRPRIEGIVDQVLEPLKHRAEFDLIEAFAAPIPFLVLAEIVGVEESAQQMLRNWGEAKIQSFDPFRSAETRARLTASDAGLRQYFLALIAERRVAPKDDLISDLVRANEQGETLSEEEMVTMCSLLIIAGTVTITDLIGNGVLALLRHPAQCEKLKERPGLIVRAVEEMLRFDSSVIQTGRIAVADMTVGNRKVLRGDSISLSLGAANRDPGVYLDADAFDIERMHIHHQSFGGGVHFCLGAALARAEAQVAIGKLLSVFPDLRLASEQVPRKRLPVLHGCQSLRMVTGATAGTARRGL